MLSCRAAGLQGCRVHGAGEQVPTALHTAVHEAVWLVESSLLWLFFFQMQHQTVGALAWTGVAVGGQCCSPTPLSVGGSEKSDLAGTPYQEIGWVFLSCLLPPASTPLLTHNRTAKPTSAGAALVVCGLSASKAACSVSNRVSIILNAIGLSGFSIWWGASILQRQNLALDAAVIGLLLRHTFQAAGATEDISLHQARPLLVALAALAALAVLVRLIRCSAEVTPVVVATAGTDAEREHVVRQQLSSWRNLAMCSSVCIGLGASMLLLACAVDIPFVLVRRGFKSNSAADVLVPSLCSAVLVLFTMIPP